MPLMGHPGHADLIEFLRQSNQWLGQPELIIIVSAHWEESIPTILSGSSPELYFDYYNFPAEAYQITYPAKGAPEWAQKIEHLLSRDNIECRLDRWRGFDHGVFVPLKLMFPKADIPCLQISLMADLTANAHIRLGEALQALKTENVLILGSGFSFHNMKCFGKPGEDLKNEAFDHWLRETLLSESLMYREKHLRLSQWDQAPYARYCHPREEHLLPLHVCFGAAGDMKPTLVFNQTIMNRKASGFLW